MDAPPRTKPFLCFTIQSAAICKECARRSPPPFFQLVNIFPTVGQILTLYSGSYTPIFKFFKFFLYSIVTFY
jgi:hypothetical protein